MLVTEEADGFVERFQEELQVVLIRGLRKNPGGGVLHIPICYKF